MNNDGKKVAIFDFCGTLVSFQSADRYIRYVMREEKIEIPKMSGMISALNKIFFIVFNISLNKLVLLKKIKGLPKETMKKYAYQFYRNEITPALLDTSIQYLHKLKEEGYYIVIASAGFDIYIQYFAEEMKVDRIICSEIDFKEEKCLGKLSDYDLIGRKKVKKLKNIFHRSSLRTCDSIAISDSRSDLPLLNYCRKAVVVCKEKPDWVDENMEVLLWN